MARQNTPDIAEFVRWFRNSSPYINACRNRTFVVTFGGEVLADAQFSTLVQDLALLNNLGVRLVLVYGTRPQTQKCLRANGGELKQINGLTVTDDAALQCVKQAVGSVRVDIEAVLSMGLANSPMAGADIRVVSGNFVTAKPVGVHQGVDYGHSGEVRRIDSGAIHANLDSGALVLLPPLGYSPTGEVFNLGVYDVASAAAIALDADKLIHLVEGKGIVDNRKRLLRELTLLEAESLLAGANKLDADAACSLTSAIHACRHNVARTHILKHQPDGSLLLELFTRDGCGTLVTQDFFEDTRQANLQDIGGLLELITPLEQEGILVRRSRERLETEINHFTVVERDGMIVACAASYPFIDEKVSELACLAVHPDYRDQGKGDALLSYTERSARQLGINQLFVLTTQTAHWFRERGFKPGALETLPVKRRALYNYRRNAKVYIKEIH